MVGIIQFFLSFFAYLYWLYLFQFSFFSSLPSSCSNRSLCCNFSILYHFLNLYKGILLALKPVFSFNNVNNVNFYTPHAVIIELSTLTDCNSFCTVIWAQFPYYRTPICIFSIFPRLVELPSHIDDNTMAGTPIMSHYHTLFMHHHPPTYLSHTDWIGLSFVQ